MNFVPRLFAAGLLLLLFSAAAVNAQSTLLAITNVAIVDVDNPNEPLLYDRTILIDGQRIARVAPSAELTPPETARVLDGRGKFVIPGLWDMHVHTLRKERVASFPTLFIANGVTSVRDMGTGWSDFVALLPTFRQLHEKGEGPRVFSAGVFIDGSPSRLAPVALEVNTDEDARSFVRKMKAGNADLVKVYSRLTRSQYLTTAAEAKAQGIAFAGHVPWAVTPREASEAGQQSIEHLGSLPTGILPFLSKHEDKINERVQEELRRPGASDLSILAVQRATIPDVLQGFDDRKAQALFDVFKANGTWHTPTLCVLRSVAFRSDARFATDSRVKYLPPQITATWETETRRFLSGASPTDISNARALYQLQLDVVGRMHRAGVSIVAGTDVLNPYVFPGFSLHDELALLVEAGLTPLDALRAATIKAAQLMGQQELVGSIAANKRADLVLLNANPLEQIRNTTQIMGVVVNGRFHSDAQLAKQLDAVARANAAASKILPSPSR